MMESLERCLHRIDNRIAEREVIFLRSANGVFLAEIADTDGDVIGRHGKVPIMVYVMVELKYHSPVFSSWGKQSHPDSFLFNDREMSLPVSTGFEYIQDIFCNPGWIFQE